MSDMNMAESMREALEAMRTSWGSEHGKADNVHLALTKSVEELDGWLQAKATEEMGRFKAEAAFGKISQAMTSLKFCVEQHVEGRRNSALVEFNDAFELMKQAHVLLINDVISRMNVEETPCATK